MIVYLSRGEIAERLGMPLDTVKKLDTRGTDFPEPDAMVGRNRGWLPRTIDEWHALREFDRKQRAAAREAADTAE